MFLYLNTSYIIYDIVSLRVNLSVSFFILSIYFSLRKKHTPFLIFLLLSIGSHYSSLLLYFVFLLSFNFRNKSKFTLMTLAVLLYFTSYLLLELALTLNINPLLSIYVTEAEKAPDIFSFNNLFISFLFIVLFSFFDKVNENLRVLWLTSFYLFLISNSLSSAPIIYFRYIDPSLLMLIIYIVSVKNCYGFRVRYYFGVIGISIFSIYKVISTLYLNPILNSSSYIV